MKNCLSLLTAHCLLLTPLMIYRLTIQYDGTDFHGWQMQGDLRTVQGELTRALSLLEGREVVVHGAGRTDAGVHAEGQVASVEMTRVMEPEKLRAAINGNIGRDVRVIEVGRESNDFHARFSARGKTYCYRVFNASFISPFWVRYAHHETRRLDFGRMREAASIFIGEHDWTAFSSAQAEVTSRVRNVTGVEFRDYISSRGCGPIIEIWVSAEGFLRYMARSIVGTLLAVGRGEMDLPEVEHALTSGDRSAVASTAPAHGLTLVAVKY